MRLGNKVDPCICAIHCRSRVSRNYDHCDRQKVRTRHLNPRCGSFWRKTNFTSCRWSKIRARAEERSCNLSERGAQWSGGDICCFARAGIVAGFDEYYRATSNWIACNRWGLLEPTLFASVLDSGDLVFCFVFDSESARKQSTESRSLLDPNLICFGAWIWARRPVHLRMDAL